LPPPTSSLRTRLSMMTSIPFPLESEIATIADCEIGNDCWTVSLSDASSGSVVGAGRGGGATGVGRSTKVAVAVGSPTTIGAVACGVRRLDGLGA
jgi:hypothetical protein